MSAARTRRRRRRQKRTRRPQSLTARRAVIVGQAMQDLARHGRLFALAALVLNAKAEIRDMQLMAELAPGGLVEKAVRAQLVPDRSLETWRQVGRIFGKCS